MTAVTALQNDLCPSCPQLHEESLEKQTLELKEAEQRSIARFIENLLLLFAFACLLPFPTCLHVFSFVGLTFDFYGNRYVAATASRQAAGEALKQTVDLAEEHSCIEAEERSLKIIGRRMNQSWYGCIA